MRRPRSVHHVHLAERLLRRQAAEALRVRLALARPIDAEFAERLRAAMWER